MPIVDQYTYLGVEISKNCSSDAHIYRVIQKGKTEVGKMDMILRDSRLHTRIKRCILLNVIVPKLEYAGEVWEGNKKLAEKLETVQMSAAKKILGCSKTTSNTALRAELGIYALKTNRDMRKLRWQHSVRSMQSERLPAIVDRAVWKKATKGQPVRWDKEVERIWQEIGGKSDAAIGSARLGPEPVWFRGS